MDSPPLPPTTAGGAPPSSTRCTSAASPTATATAPATWPAVRARLPYLAELGVDALWFNPWYRSPMKDGGYDVADYRAVDPAFGTLAEAEKLIAEARELGIRTIVDIVPNHVSDQHPWFRAALAGGPERELFHFRPDAASTANSRPTTGSPSSAAPPGPGCPTATGTCTCSPPSSPTSTGPTPPSARSTRTSCASGSSGASQASASTPPPCSPRTPHCPISPRDTTPPYVDRDELHDVYRAWRAVADEYGPSSSARSGSPTPNASPATCAPTNCTPRSTSPS